MPNRYRDIYPSEAALRSEDALPIRAAQAIRLDYFRAPAGEMPTLTYDEHHVLMGLAETPTDTENFRNGQSMRYDFGRNDVVITPAGVESGWRWHQQSHCIVVLIRSEELERFARQHLGLLLNEGQLRDVPKTHDPDLVESGEMLLGALKERRTGVEVLYEAYSRIFLVKLLDRYSDRMADHAFDEDFSGQHYRRMMDYVGAHFPEALSVDDLATAAGLSTALFAREFKRVVGKTPYKFLMTYRIERAQQMMREPDHAMIDIALSCGFSDQAHFSRTFKSITGHTPSAYLKLLSA
ncbi:MAG: AraC family transcriptional regulator [Pseudomonadota bacterium]